MINKPDSPGITWGPDSPAPLNAPVKPEDKPKSKKGKAKLDKSEAAKIKEAIERGQVGAPEPEKEKPEPKPVKGKKLKAKTQQLDMVTEGKILVAEPNSPLYKAGKRLAEAVEQVDLAVEEKGEALQEVIKAMRVAKRYNYKVAGYIFELVHKGASDNVKVIKPK